MDPSTLFQIANPMAMVGWLALLATPLSPLWTQRIAGLVIPLLLSVAYVGLIFAFWTGAEGGFDTLANVMKLFEDPNLVLAGWLHFLAFDLFVGAWIARTGRAEGAPFLLLIPCFALAFLFGPAGFLLFTIMRAILAARAQAKEA